MYTAQLMDNLICAAENRPFVQVVYHALQVTDEHILAGNLGGEFDPNSTKALAAASRALLTSMKSLASTLSFGASFNNNRTMQVFADPVLAQDDVYTYYLAFAHDPQLFVCSEFTPPCTAHVQKKCGKKWYWVPEEAAGVFLQLALKTTFMRGPEPPPPVFWDTTILSVDPSLREKGDPIANKWVVTLVTPVPNDDGTLYVTVDGVRRSFLIEPVLEMPFDLRTPNRYHPGPKPGAPTSILYLWAKPETEVKDKLPGQPAQFYAAQNPNPGAISPDLQRLEAAVEAYQRSHAPLPSPSLVSPPADGKPAPEPELLPAPAPLPPASTAIRRGGTGLAVWAETRPEMRIASLS